MEEKILSIHKSFAKIHSIDSFSTVDGPGIRFVIFMQGCHLKCKYCQNRDTWDISGGKYYSLNEIFDRIMQYKNYLIPSGGGVTISGGEPLLQANFLIELFQKLKQENIHTCIDTSGIVSITNAVKELLNLTDLVLLDIKHINSEKCKALVGYSNELELNFAKYLNNQKIHMWIRQVLIPGITDNKEDLLKLKEFLSTLEYVQKIEILPYHTLGKNKWLECCFPYELDNIREATQEDVNRAQQIIGIKPVKGDGAK